LFRAGSGAERALLLRKVLIFKIKQTMQKHRPPHIYRNEQYYFVTAGTFRRIAYVHDASRKKLLKELIFKSLSRYQYLLDAWVILDNHYHLLFKSALGKYLPEAIATIHGKSAIEINKIDKSPGRQIWFQYWDYCIRNEEDYWRHFNYIHYNPIKHSYVTGTENLCNFPFSSFGAWVERRGEEWISDCSRRYPIIDFTREEDNF